MRNINGHSTGNQDNLCDAKLLDDQIVSILTRGSTEILTRRGMEVAPTGLGRLGSQSMRDRDLLVNSVGMTISSRHIARFAGIAMTVVSDQAAATRSRSLVDADCSYYQRWAAQ